MTREELAEKAARKFWDAYQDEIEKKDPKFCETRRVFDLFQENIQRLTVSAMLIVVADILDQVSKEGEAGK